MRKYLDDRLQYFCYLNSLQEEKICFGLRNSSDFNLNYVFLVSHDHKNWVSEVQPWSGHGCVGKCRVWKLFQNAQFHRMHCIPERLLCVSAPCSAVRQRPPTASFGAEHWSRAGVWDRQAKKCKISCMIDDITRRSLNGTTNPKRSLFPSRRAEEGMDLLICLCPGGICAFSVQLYFKFNIVVFWRFTKCIHFQISE